MEAHHPLVRFLWPWRTLLGNRTVFGKQMKASGRTWWEHLEHYRDKLRTPLSIAFAFVATHNHFVLDRGGKLFKQSAPIIKLPAEASEEEHLALLAYLNSSTAGFFFRQAGHSKGAQGVNEGHKSEIWEQFLEYSGTLVGATPVPPEVDRLIDLARRMDDVARVRDALRPHSVLESWQNSPDGSLSEQMTLAKKRYTEQLHVMVALQEEIDWTTYELFGLLSAEQQASLRDAIPAQTENAPGIPPGIRPFEFALMQTQSPGRPGTSWFERNAYRHPQDWTRACPASMQELTRTRVSIIASSKLIRLLEQPEHKHRWTVLDHEQAAHEAAREWLSARIKQVFANDSRPLTTSEMRSCIERDKSVTDVLKLLGTPDLQTLMRELINAGQIPFLSVLRYKPTGLAKHQVWQQTWALQRREDAGETIQGDIPVPPKYASKDYCDPAYWHLRGKLDSPRERFIGYPGCESDHDLQPVYGWAGWNHLQRAQALAALYQARKLEEAWPAERLTPILAGLLELIQWVKQWHNAPDPDFDNLRMGDYFETFLVGQCREFALTEDDLRAWRPPKKQRGKRGKRTSKRKPW